jgi:osmotically-inducible protein OsmY
MAATTQSGCSVRLRAGALAIGLSVALLSGCGPSRPADDFTTSTKVKIELLADPDLSTMRLDVSTLNGVVTLAGTVRSQADVDRAVAAAKKVSGVRAVKSELKIGG